MLLLFFLENNITNSSEQAWNRMSEQSHKVICILKAYGCEEIVFSIKTVWIYG